MSKVYPVIHYYNKETTISEAAKAFECGADGVFLISHIGQNEKLIPLAIEIKEKFKMKVGINFLGDDVLSTAKIVEQNNLDMVWSDDCGVSSAGLNFNGFQLKEWSDANPNIEVFASVAFKYQIVDNNPPLAALNALNAGFIPTTSGSGTGSAPTLEKIRPMSKMTKGKIAVASGMTCENIHIFKTHLSDILVSTGISDDDYHFNVEKMKKFIQIAHS